MGHIIIPVYSNIKLELQLMNIFIIDFLVQNSMTLNSLLKI